MSEVEGASVPELEHVASNSKERAEQDANNQCCRALENKQLKVPLLSCQIVDVLVARYLTSVMLAHFKDKVMLYFVHIHLFTNLPH